MVITQRGKGQGIMIEKRAKWGLGNVRNVQFLDLSSSYTDVSFVKFIDMYTCL